MSDVIIPAWTLGDRLQKARLTAGFRHPRDLAVVLGVSDKTVRNYENNETEQRMPTLRSWAQVTGVPLWWLLGEEPGTPDTQEMRVSRCTALPSLVAA